MDHRIDNPEMLSPALNSNSLHSVDDTENRDVEICIKIYDPITNTKVFEIIRANPARTNYGIASSFLKSFGAEMNLGANDGIVNMEVDNDSTLEHESFEVGTGKVQTSDSYSPDPDSSRQENSESPAEFRSMEVVNDIDTPSVSQTYTICTQDGSVMSEHNYCAQIRDPPLPNNPDCAKNREPLDVPKNPHCAKIRKPLDASKNPPRAQIVVGYQIRPHQVWYRSPKVLAFLTLRRLRTHHDLNVSPYKTDEALPMVWQESAKAPLMEFFDVSKEAQDAMNAAEANDKLANNFVNPDVPQPQRALKD